MKYKLYFDKSLSLYNDRVCPTELLMPFIEVERMFLIMVEGINSPLSWRKWQLKKTKTEIQKKSNRKEDV